MLIFGEQTRIPPALCGPFLIDSAGLQRYWALIWSFFKHADLANSSKVKQLRHVEKFYEFADQLKGLGALDDALAAKDIVTLGEIIEAYFVSIQNQPNVNVTSDLKWQTAFQFVQDTILRLSKSNMRSSELHEIEGRLNKLSILYQQLRIARKRQQDAIRSLPASVVEALYLMLDPESPTNPFRNTSTRWKVYLIFIVLLHQGLRRGELLLQPVNAIRSEFDGKLNKERHWLSVTFNDYEEDTRYSKPGIKTPSSIRQIPVDLPPIVVPGDS